MKKVFSLIAFAIAMMISTPAQAQVAFGVKGGLNVTNMSMDGEVFDASNRAGWFIGPTLKITLPIVGLGVDGSVLYDTKTASVTKNGKQSTSVTQQQLAFPVNVRYAIGLGETANVFFFGGPQWAINVGDKNFEWDDHSSYSFKKSNFSVNLGGGVMLMNHLQISANYNIACGKTADVKNFSGAVKAASDNADNSRTNSWQLGLAYFF